MRAIQKHGLKTLNEDEFLNLIATRKGVVDEKYKAKMEKEEQKIREAAKEMEKAERKAEKAAVGKNGAPAKGADLKSQLWTVRYAPQSLKEICGNKTQVDKLQTWLRDWYVGQRSSRTHEAHEHWFMIGRQA
jgi:replication factor C subunit 1